MEKILFKEEQHFSQSWLWLLILISFGVPAVVMIIFLVKETKSNSDEITAMGFSLLFLIATGTVISLLFLKMKLFIEITGNEVRFRYPPLISKWRSIRKEEIERFEVRKYRPVSEYGGWGIKKKRKSNVAYNVRGNIGLQLYLKNGKKILIGTQRRQAIDYAMDKMMNGENSG